AAAALSVLGFGAAYVLASTKQAAPGPGKIAICHSTSSATNQFNLEKPDASGDLNGHANHPDDIIPAIGTNPAKNMTTIYPGGWTGADILANDCNIPSAGGGITQTVTTTVPVTVTAPASTVTTPGETITREFTVTATAPGQTVTTPGATTVVTVPSGQTTT